MKNQHMLIVFLLVFLFSNCRVKTIYTHKMMNEITCLDDILPVARGDVDHVSLIVYLHEDCPNCHTMEPIIVEYTE